MWSLVIVIAWWLLDAYAFRTPASTTVPFEEMRLNLHAKRERSDLSIHSSALSYPPTQTISTSSGSDTREAENTLSELKDESRSAIQQEEIKRPFEAKRMVDTKRGTYFSSLTIPVNATRAITIKGVSSTDFIRAPVAGSKVSAVETVAQMKKGSYSPFLTTAEMAMRAGAMVVSPPPPSSSSSSSSSTVQPAAGSKLEAQKGFRKQLEIKINDFQSGFRRRSSGPVRDIFISRDSNTNAVKNDRVITFGFNDHRSFDESARESARRAKAEKYRASKHEANTKWLTDLRLELEAMERAKISDSSLV